MVDEFRRRTSPWAVGLVKSFLYRRQLRRWALQSKSLFADEALKYPACYYRDVIYISFESGTAHEVAIATVVVHELSHALWERIAGTCLYEERQQLRDASAEKHRLFAEGFATYGELAWFLDFFPESMRCFARWRLDPTSVYGKGFCRVQQLVKEHGPNILLEIPKRWREL